MPPGTIAEAQSQHLAQERDGRREQRRGRKGKCTDHSVLHCVHFMWLHPALFCVATRQPGHGLVSDRMTSSVFFSDSRFWRAH